MAIEFTKEALEKLISDGVEENMNLEYKAGDALQNTEGKKKEIAKDVSSMANSAGGIIIYGISEFEDPLKKHLPEKITPINRRQFSKEQLEQIINSNISPKIEGLLLHPIPLNGTDQVVYAVEIPQSTTAHQNTADGRYYRRYNFQSVWMHDYEIRDILNRAKHPVVEIDFTIEKITVEITRNPNSFYPLGEPQKSYRTDFYLKIFPNNKGNMYAQFINYFVQIPHDFIQFGETRKLTWLGKEGLEYYGENTYRDVIDVQLGLAGMGAINKYGPSRFDPVLPGLKGRSEKLQLEAPPQLDEREIKWSVYADNAPPRSGKIKLKEIQVIEKTSDD